MWCTIVLSIADGVGNNGRHSTMCDLSSTMCDLSSTMCDLSSTMCDLSSTMCDLSRHRILPFLASSLLLAAHANAVCEVKYLIPCTCPYLLAQ